MFLKTYDGLLTNNNIKESQMKTILRIIIILLVMSVIAGASIILVNNYSLTSLGSGNEDSQHAAVISSSGQSTDLPPAHLENGMRNGKEGSASILGSMSQFLTMILKLIGITITILLIEKGICLLKKNRILRLA